MKKITNFFNLLNTQKKEKRKKKEEKKIYLFIYLYIYIVFDKLIYFSPISFYSLSKVLKIKSNKEYKKQEDGFSLF